MKHFFLLTASILFLNTNAQTCNQSSFVPTTSYQSGTTSVNTNTTATQLLYLCPNSYVFDTLNVFCRVVIVEANAVYTVKTKSCGSNIYAKNNSTVIVKAGSILNGVTIIHELGAIIVNQTTLTALPTSTCASILTPTNVNCSITSVPDKTTFNSENISVYPNPSNSYLEIESPYDLNEAVEVTITNLLGSVVFKNEVFLEDKLKISVQNIGVGIYYLAIKAKNLNVIKKIVIEK